MPWPLLNYSPASCNCPIGWLLQRGWSCCCVVSIRARRPDRWRCGLGVGRGRTRWRSAQQMWESRGENACFPARRFPRRIQRCSPAWLLSEPAALEFLENSSLPIHRLEDEPCRLRRHQDRSDRRFQRGLYLQKTFCRRRAVWRKRAPVSVAAFPRQLPDSARLLFFTTGI